MQRRIAISGSAGTGKSTLADALASNLDVPYLDEGMRRRRNAGLDMHALSRTELKDLILALYEEALVEATSCPGGFVQDRCPVDYLAFWLHYDFWGDDAESATMFKRVKADLSHYDQIIVLPWGAFEIDADGVRSTNRWLQLKFQALLEGLLHRLAPSDLIYWMPQDIVSIDKRLSHVHSRLVST